MKPETRIKLPSNKREVIRGPQGKRNEPLDTAKTVTFGGNSLMLLLYVKSDDSRKLVKIDDNLNSGKIHPDAEG